MSRPVDYAALTRRTCRICKKTKAVDDFHRFADASAPLTGWRYYSHCIECNKAECREYGAKAKPKRNARLRQWRKENPEKVRSLDRRRHLSRYGLKEADYERMFLAQGGRCFLCDRFSERLAIDHCHKTGKVRKLLCTRCNAHVGWIENHPSVYKRVSDYLQLANAAICEEVVV